MFMYFSRPYLTGFLSGQFYHRFLSRHPIQKELFQWKYRGEQTVVEFNMKIN